MPFTTENTAGVDQVVFPTFPVVMGYGAGRGVMSEIGSFNPALLVHGQQAVTLHRPIPPQGTATLTSKLTDMFDKGKAAAARLQGQAPRADVTVQPLDVGSLDSVRTAADALKSAEVELQRRCFISSEIAQAIASADAYLGERGAAPSSSVTSPERARRLIRRV